MGRIGLINSRRRVVGRDRPGRGRAHRGDQQARRRHGPDLAAARRSSARWPRASSCSTRSRTSTWTPRSPRLIGLRQPRWSSGHRGCHPGAEDGGRLTSGIGTDCRYEGRHLRAQRRPVRKLQARDKGVHVADTAERVTPRELDRVIIRFAGHERARPPRRNAPPKGLDALLARLFSVGAVVGALACSFAASLRLPIAWQLLGVSAVFAVAMGLATTRYLPDAGPHPSAGSEPVKERIFDEPQALASAQSSARQPGRSTLTPVEVLLGIMMFGATLGGGCGQRLADPRAGG